MSLDHFTDEVTAEEFYLDHREHEEDATLIRDDCHSRLDFLMQLTQRDVCEEKESEALLSGAQ